MNSTSELPLAPFTDSDIRQLTDFAEEHGLPPIVRSEIHGTTALVLVADGEAVTAWADRLETDVTTYFGVPATMFRQDGYELWIAVEQVRKVRNGDG